MNSYTATVIKTGNSYALRVPKAYVDNAHLALGQKVQVGTPLKATAKQDPSEVKKAIRNLQQLGAYKDIKDPIAWQREIRKDRPLPGRK
jgi:antitoxin component of MazEF toxin-antitoxin module